MEPPWNRDLCKKMAQNPHEPLKKPPENRDQKNCPFFVTILSVVSVFVKKWRGWRAAKHALANGTVTEPRQNRDFLLPLWPIGHSPTLLRPWFWYHTVNHAIVYSRGLV